MKEVSKQEFLSLIRNEDIRERIKFYTIHLNERVLIDEKCKAITFYELDNKPLCLWLKYPNDERFILFEEPKTRKSHKK